MIPDEPIRLLKKPYKASVLGRNKKKLHSKWQYLTNKGKKTLTELATIAKMTPGGFGTRLRHFGWDHPHLFDPPGVGYWSIVNLKAEWKEKHGEVVRGAEGELGCLAKIPDTPRTHLLAKIKPPGTWESRRRTRYDDIQPPRD